MLATKRRRQDLGVYASAALPVIWSELARREWTHARLASELGESNARVARLLYGDRRPGLDLAVAINRLLGTDFGLWNTPCPKGFRPHRDSTSKRAA